MPATTMDQVQKLETQLKEAIAGLGDAPDVAKKRELGKKLRRAQRMRRKLGVEEARRVKTAQKPAAPKAEAAAPAAEAKPAEAPAAEAPAEEKPAEDA